MIVYGDHARNVRVDATIRQLLGHCADISSLPPSLGRHANVVRLLIESGQLVQGLLDFRFHERGFDEEGELERVCSKLLVEVASLVVDSRADAAGIEASHVILLIQAIQAMELP